jgi:hypothetical protein
MEQKKAGFLKFYSVRDNKNREEQKKNATRNWFFIRSDGILFHASDKSKVQFEISRSHFFAHAPSLFNKWVHLLFELK